MTETCYMCSEQETSDEHVPPRCFFPKVKDTPGENYRDDPIIVPSCYEHNSKKSAIDEYLRQTIVMHYANNPKPQKDTMKAILRAFENQPGKLVNLKESSDPVLLNSQETITIEVDLEKFESGMSHIAHGLYYHECHKAWPHPFEIFTLEFFGDNHKHRAQKMNLVNGFNQMLSIVGFKGKHPSIFKYRHYVEEKINMALFHLIFYEGFEVYAYSSNN